MFFEAKECDGETAGEHRGHTGSEVRTHQRPGLYQFLAHGPHALDDPLRRGRLLRRHGVDQHLGGVPRQRQRAAPEPLALELRDEVVERGMYARLAAFVSLDAPFTRPSTLPGLCEPQ